MFERDFIFVGYLIQEPYWKDWPKRDGYRVASIQREWHPRFNRFQWNKVNGIKNPTRFLTELPRLDLLSLEPHDCTSAFHKRCPGWVISGYSFPSAFVARQTMTSTDGKTTLHEFGYAGGMKRTEDGLILLGYEVLDAEDTFLSILNDCDYSVEQVREMAGPMNEFSLLSSVEDAERFIEAIKRDASNPGIVPDHNRGVIIQIWGQP